VPTESFPRKTREPAMAAAGATRNS